MNLLFPARPADHTKNLADTARFFERLAASVPQPMPPIIEWAEANVRLNGAKGEMFRIDNTPWTRLPIELCFQPHIRSVTYVKPTRTGGSAAGHVVICGWSKVATGQIQYNWPNDGKAEEIWDKEFEKILAQSIHYRRYIADRFKARKGLVILPNCSISMQGVFAESALDSDTVPYQVNEEVHAWAHGMLAKAYGRGDACDFPIRFNISNAGMEGDQLHEAFKDGTQRQWEVACPHCGNPNFEANKVYHTMRVRWDDKHPEHGGLWYDHDRAKRPDGSYDYNVIASTVEYRMPCGGRIPNDIVARRALSASGRYSAPYNTGAMPGYESMTHQAVIAHTMDWVNIIRRRNNALAARRSGDEDSFRKYVQEVECEFYSPSKIPFSGETITVQSVVKDRAGLPDRAFRQATFDWQQGYKHKGQLIHYWGVIRDVLSDCNSQIVWEGMVTSDTELNQLIREFEVDPAHVLIDASKNTKAILQLCYQQGYKAVMLNASHVGTFRDHPDKVPRYYSAGKPIHAQLNVKPIYEYVFGERQADGTVPVVPDPREPLIIEVNKAGLLSNHFFCRNLKTNVIENCKLENPPRVPDPCEYFSMVIPGDVSEEFLRQYDSWERKPGNVKTRTGDLRSRSGETFRQLIPDDHLLMCVAFADMYLDWCFLLGDALASLGIRPETETTNEAKKYD